MKQFAFAFIVLVNSFVAHAAYELPTKNHALNLTCILDSTPFFIELDRTHTKAKLHFNSQYDDENGQTHLRRLLADFSLAKKSGNVLNFHKPKPRNNNVQVLSVLIPSSINVYAGMPNQPVTFGTIHGETYLGTCYVQFLPVPPSL